MFFDRCGPFDISDLVEWIFRDVSYPYSKILTANSDKELLSLISTSEKSEKDVIKQKLISKITNHKNGSYAGQVEWMSHHDMFR